MLKLILQLLLFTDFEKTVSSLVYRCHPCDPGGTIGPMEVVDLKEEEDLVVAVMMAVVVDDIDPTSLEDQWHVVFG